METIAAILLVIVLIVVAFFALNRSTRSATAPHSEVALLTSVYQITTRFHTGGMALARVDVIDLKTGDIIGLDIEAAIDLKSGNTPSSIKTAVKWKSALDDEIIVNSDDLRCFGVLRKHSGNGFFFTPETYVRIYDAQPDGVKMISFMSGSEQGLIALEVGTNQS